MTRCRAFAYVVAVLVSATPFQGTSMAKRKAPIQDDATLAGMSAEPTKRAPKVKHAAVDTRPLPWERVALECPVGLDADYHRERYGLRHHVERIAGRRIILCVPVTATVHPIDTFPIVARRWLHNGLEYSLTLAYQSTQEYEREAVAYHHRMLTEPKRYCLCHTSS